MTTSLFTYFILCALICYVYADLSFGVVDSGIDPGRIFWWQGQWSPIAVELSKINQEAANVKVTVRWRPMTTVKDCLLELELPSNFVVENNEANLSEYVGTVISGEEYLTTFSQTVTNPESGVYGPVKIRTRHYISNYDSFWAGQIVDANQNFAMLYIAPSEDSMLTELRVAILESYPKVGDKAKTLRVQFNLADDVWKHDLVKLTTDPHFTLSSTVTCSSYKEAGKISYFNGTSAVAPLSINCASSVTEEYGDPDFLYIYGLGNDIETSIENANSVEIRVSSVKLPDRKYLTFNWKLEIIRYATRWVLQSGTYTEGPLINPGAIITASWAPTWSQISKDKILPTMKIFIDVSITTVNTIHEGGSLLFEFSENIDKLNYVGNTAVGCYINNNIADLACAVSDADKRVTITGFKETPPFKLVVTIAAKFDSDTRASITSIATKDESGLFIDSASNSGLSTIGSTSIYTLLQDTGNTNGITFECEPANCNKVLPTNATIWLRMGLLGQSLYIKSGVKFTVYLPMVTQSDAASQDKAFYINNDSNTKFRYVGHATTAPTSVTDEGYEDNYQYKEVVPAITSSVGRDSGSFTWTFDNSYPTYMANRSANTENGVDKVMQNTVHLAIVRTAGDSMTMPFVESNAETRYQFAIEIRDTNAIPAFNPYFATLQYSFASMEWETAVFTPFSTFNLQGTPAEVQFIPKANNPFPPISASVEGRTYYIEVELNGFPSLMGSGLDSGDAYPCVPISGVSKLEDINCEIIQDTNTLVRMKDLKQILSTDSNIKWYLTLGSQSILTDVNPIIRGIMIEDDDLRKVKNIIYESTATSYTPVDSTLSAYVATIATSTVTYSLVAGDELSVSNTFGSHALQGGTGSIDYAVFIFPTGFTINDSTAALKLSITGIDSSMTNIMAFSAEGMNWATLMGKEEAADKLIDSGSLLTAIKVGGVKVAGYEGTANVFRALCKTDFGATTPIMYSSSASTSITNGAFIDLAVSPTSVKGRGPGSTRTDVSVTFTTKNPIPAGGAIVLEMNDKWEYISDELNGRCVFSGLTDKDNTSQVSCSYSLSKWTITNFSSVASGQKITVIFYNLLPPSYLGSTKQKFVISLTSYKESLLTTKVDSLSSPIEGNEVSVTANTATVGSSDVLAVQSIPMNAGLGRAVDLYIVFSFQYSIPKGGYFELELKNLFWNYNDKDISGKCWLNGIRYASCEYIRNIKVTLGEDYEAPRTLELYLDDAINNPASTTTIKDAFMFHVYYGSMLIIEDYTGAAFTALDKIPELNENSISVQRDTVGGYGDYTFSFESSLNLLATDQIWIIFPKDFDYFVGNAKVLYSEEGSTYYLECSSSLGDTLCTVDHNMVVVKGTYDKQVGTPITITLYDVANPRIDTQKTSERFQVFQYDTLTKTIKAGSQDFGTITTSELIPTILKIKSVDADIRTLFEKANYEFAFYLSESLKVDEDHSIYIEFPRQYQLVMESLSSIKCSATIQEDGKDEVEWLKSPDCSLKGNSIVLKIPSTSSTNREFLGWELIRIKLINIPNPQWGYRRTINLNIQDWEYDVKDNLSFGGHDSWTDKFYIHLYSETAKDFIRKSYPESYAGYLGYDNLGKELFVNDFKPETWDNRITVYAGTQSKDIYITTESVGLPCATKSLVFSYSIYYYKTQGSSSINVNLSSVLDKQIMYNGFYSIAIRLSAPIEARKGFYFISWDIFESMHSGVPTELYQPPVRTLVEVTHGNPFKFIIGEFPNIYRGEQSPPISISISNPPDTSVTIYISVKPSSQSTKVKVTPSLITFYPDVDIKYFTLEVELDFALSISTSEILTFQLSGEDAEAFTIDGEKTVTISSGNAIAGVITDWGIDQITQTSARFSPKSTKEGMIYVHLAVSGTKIPSARELISTVGEVVELVGNGYERDTLNDLELAKSMNQDINNTEMNLGESWRNFRERVYKLHVGYVFVTAFSVKSNGETDPFVVDWLWGDTEYQITGYHVVGAHQSSAKTEIFFTSNTENSVSFKMRFIGNVPNDYNVTIKQVLGKNLGISPSRFQYVKKENFSTRQLQTASSTSTEMQFYLLQERNIASPTPDKLVRSIPTIKTSIQADLRTVGFRYTLSDITDPVDLFGEKPNWEIMPRLGVVTYDSITIEFLADIAGHVTCIADDINDTKPTPYQVYLGLNAVNAEVLYMRVATDTAIFATLNEITFDELHEATTYYIWCVVSDNLPVWPILQFESTSSPVGLVLTTEEYENPEEAGGSAGVYMKYLVSLLVLAII